MLAGRKLPRVVELRQQQCVDPFAVGRAGYIACNLGPDVAAQFIAHIPEAIEIAVMRHHQFRARVPERVNILIRDADVAMKRHAADMAQKAVRPDLLRQALQISVENRKGCLAMSERKFRVMRGVVPDHHAKAREVQHLQHARHVGLFHHRTVGLKQQKIEQYGLAEI